MEDHKLLELLFDRSSDAIRALQQRFGRRLYRTALNILGSAQDAEEAVNDTYLAIWNAIPPERPDPLEGYVHRTGRNIALNRLRRQTAQKRFCGYDCSLDELADTLGSSCLEEELDARLLGQAIDRFLDTIPKTSRILFLRRYWFGDQVRQIAKDLGMSENTVSVRLTRIRSALKDYLIKEDFIDEKP